MHHVVLHLERTIDASHVLPDHPGKCGRLHGHTYRFQVWCSGPVDPGDGMLVDFGDVKGEIDAWDHRHLNDEVDFTTTAENLAAEMRRRIVERLRAKVAAHAGDEVADTQVGVVVRLWETPSGYAQSGTLVPHPGPIALDPAGEVAGIGAP